MLARDWYYNQRRRLGLDRAVMALCDHDDDSDLRARAALSMLGVKKGWRVADIGCGNGVFACEAALMGAEVDAIDISPAMLTLAELHARNRRAPIRTRSSGLLSFAYEPNSYDLIVSEFTLHHLADFNTKNHDFARDTVVSHMRDEYSTFGWVIERMLTEVGFTLVSVDYSAPMHGTYLLQKPNPGAQS